MKKVLFGLMGATFAFAEAEEATKAYDLYAGAGASYQMLKQTVSSTATSSKKHNKFGGSVFFGGMYFADDYGFGLELGYDLARSKKYGDDAANVKVRGCNPWLVAQIAYKYNGFIPAIRFGIKHVKAEAVDGANKAKVSKIAFTLGAGLRYNLCNRFGVEGMYDYAFKAKKNFKVGNDERTQKLTGNNIRLAVTYSF